MAGNIIKLTEAPRVPFKLDGRIVFSDEKLEIVHLTLKPGEKIDPHEQPFDVIFYVLSGMGELLMNGQRSKVGKDTLITVERGINRGWINCGKRNLRLLVIKRKQ
jgi:quercetin dioxygenase-like cupin family protein